MTPKLLDSAKVLERLGREEQQLKQLGLVNHAAGVRTAIVQVLKLLSEGDSSPPLDHSD